MSSTTKGLSMAPPTHRIVQSIQISLHQSTDSTLSSLGSHSPLGTSYTPAKLNCLLACPERWEPRRVHALHMHILGLAIPLAFFVWCKSSNLQTPHDIL